MNSTVPVDTTDREIISNRVLNATQEKAFEAFRNPDLLARWWGPAGFTNTFHSFDFQPGGTWEFIMHGPDGTNYPNTNVFVEIVEPVRIVFNHVVSPLFQMTITFEKTEHPDKTLFGFYGVFESVALCQQLKPICIPANEQNFDRLEAVLASL